ncbi:MAG: STAS domain-containing protein [Paludibacterium sp.]|uniref:STAS domain-containing protein n=1 Tax=Paludibacterium sp. TaxID=1917523 RepID=UPI0025E34CFC|nr:STAS domain-containing protein [Paludibacterium sp.]MBV8045990.1 STAS domain-containing protein [Paludibacterium sp.]MBV8647330.1 STAS domain-containing protein [Paludibacterium sp.]
MQIKLQGRLDMDRCGALARELGGELKQDGQLVLDFAGSEMADSAALALILELSRAAQTKRAKLRLQHVPAGLAALATLYGVEPLIQPLTENDR